MSPYNNQQDYRLLESDDSLEEATDEKKVSVGQWLNRSSYLWLSLAVVSWVLTGGLAVAYFRDKSIEKYSYQKAGRQSLVISARNVVSIKEKVFTGAPVFTDEHKAYVAHADPVRYIGKPGPEVDQNWEELTGGRYFLVSEDEAKATWGKDYKSYYSHVRGGYIAGLDVFHTLHCLNQIRRRLHPEYYKSTHGTAESHAIHDDHCIEQIRQYLMCAGDLTVLGTKFYPGLGDHGRDYVLSDVAHTCRNFDDIRAWAWERFNGSTAVKSDKSEK